MSKLLAEGQPRPAEADPHGIDVTAARVRTRRLTHGRPTTWRAAYREARGWTQTQAADVYNKQHVSGRRPWTFRRVSAFENWPRYESESMTAELLISWGQVYGTHPRNLLDDEEYWQLHPRHRMRIDRVTAADQTKELLGAGDGPPEGFTTDEESVPAEPVDGMRRRRLLELGAEATLGALVQQDPSLSTRVADFAARLTSYTIGDCGSDTVVDLYVLSDDVAAAKRNYQACRYAHVIDNLPGLLRALHAAEKQTDGSSLARVRTLTASAYQVAGSVLLKFNDAGLAMLAAERGMQAAEASGDDVTRGTSARTVTHALTSTGHVRYAAEFAATRAQRLIRAVDKPTPQVTAVYGALLLRGAIAAARSEDRGTALELLDEAGQAAGRIGAEENLAWTAFNSTNVLLHRVHIAVTLGDAGHAIEYARKIHMEPTTVPERRACLYIDVAQAFAQRRKYEPAFRSLLAAERLAPEELAARRTVHRLVGELAGTAPQLLQPRVRELAGRIGVPR